MRGLVINGFSTCLIIQSSDNLIVGNYIGTDPGGSTSLGNADGISVISGGSNTIGGTADELRNVISGQ